MSEFNALSNKISQLEQEFKNIQDKITENDKRINERRKIISQAELTHQLRQTEIVEIESVEYQQCIDISVMVN